MQLDPPPGLYDRADSLLGDELRDELHTVARNGHLFLGRDPSRALVAAANPGILGNVLTVYSHRQVPIGHTGLPEDWTIEHAWPTSLMDPGGAGCSLMRVDAHNLYAEIGRANSSRGNAPYGFCPHCPEFDPLAGTGNRAGGNPRRFEVWRERRGDVARSVLYMELRYDSEVEQLQTRSSDCPAPEGSPLDLKLTNNLSDVGAAPGEALMGRHCDLLFWHGQDPVSDIERLHNAVVAQSQGNRNPFVDRPDFVRRVFKAACITLRLPLVYVP